MTRLILALLLLAPRCAATVTAQRGELLQYSLDFDVAPKGFVDTIAVEWRHGQLYVPVTVGGRPMRFLLDTGAGQTVIYDDVAVEGAEHLGGMMSVDALGRRDTVPVVALPTLHLGRERLTGLRAMVRHRWCAVRT